MPRKGDKLPLPEVGGADDPYGFTRLVRGYLEWMRTHHYTPATVEGREKELRRFLGWCGEHGLARPSEVTLPLLERYQRSLYHHKKANGRALAIVTQRGRLTAVQELFRWLVKSSLLLSNPASELELPRLPTTLPRFILSATEVERVLVTPDLSAPLGLRDRAILETLYSTGVRRSELVRLELADVDAERGAVLVRQGKGRRDRVVPIGARGLGWIERYVREARPELLRGAESEALFLGAGGDGLAVGYLTHLVRGYVERAALGKRGSCHLFRHSMATLMLENGADVRFVQAMLGHKKLETTALYTRVSVQKLREVHAQTHPAERTRQPAPEVPAAEPPDAKAELLAALAAEADDEPGELH